MILAILFGYFVFGEIPDLASWIGMVLILASGFIRCIVISN